MVQHHSVNVNFRLVWKGAFRRDLSFPQERMEAVRSEIDVEAGAGNQNGAAHAVVTRVIDVLHVR